MVFWQRSTFKNKTKSQYQNENKNRSQRNKTKTEIQGLIFEEFGQPLMGQHMPFSVRSTAMSPTPPNAEPGPASPRVSWPQTRPAHPSTQSALLPVSSHRASLPQGQSMSWHPSRSDRDPAPSQKCAPTTRYSGVASTRLLASEQAAVLSPHVTGSRGDMGKEEGI